MYIDVEWLRLSGSCEMSENDTIRLFSNYYRDMIPTDTLIRGLVTTVVKGQRQRESILYPLEIAAAALVEENGKGQCLWELWHMEAPMNAAVFFGQWNLLDRQGFTFRITFIVCLT